MDSLYYIASFFIGVSIIGTMIALYLIKKDFINSKKIMSISNYFFILVHFFQFYQ
jgi:DMSO/TMAO reductase YedYZ heme-binding membrane subunit